MMKIRAGRNCPRNGKRLTVSKNPAVLAGALGAAQSVDGCQSCPGRILRGPSSGEERTIGHQDVPFCKEG